MVVNVEEKNAKSIIREKCIIKKKKIQIHTKNKTKSGLE